MYGIGHRSKRLGHNHSAQCAHMHMLSVTPWKLQKGGTLLLIVLRAVVDTLTNNIHNILNTFSIYKTCTTWRRDRRNCCSGNLVHLVAWHLCLYKWRAGPIVYENYTRICCVCILWIFRVLCILFLYSAFMCIKRILCIYINYTRVPAAVLPVVPEQGESVAADHRR